MTRPPEDRPSPIRAVPDVDEDPPTPDRPKASQARDPSAAAEVDARTNPSSASMDALIDSFPPEERRAALAGLYFVGDGRARTTYQMLRVAGSPPRRRLDDPLPDSDSIDEQY